MQEVSDDLFSALMAECLDELPKEYVEGLDNVLITYEDLPTGEQRKKQKLHANQTLLGLYEGIPLTKRGAGYQFVLPDKITLFKLPISNESSDPKELKSIIKHTLWHEIAHYYGLAHDRIHEIESRWKD